MGSYAFNPHDFDRHRLSWIGKPPAGVYHRHMGAYPLAHPEGGFVANTKVIGQKIRADAVAGIGKMKHRIEPDLNGRGRIVANRLASWMESKTTRVLDTAGVLDKVPARILLTFWAVRIFAKPDFEHMLKAF